MYLEASSIVELRCDRITCPALFGDELLIVGGREQRVQFSRIFQRDLDHPGAVRIFIDLFRRRRQFAVHFGHRAGNRRVQIGDRLHRFHRAKSLAGGDLGAGLGQIDENDVAQRILSIAGDADSGILAVGFDPLVLFGVLVVGRKGHGQLLAPGF